MAIPNGYRVYESFSGTHLEGRWKIYKSAIKGIHPRYLTGRGLNYFRDTDYGRVHNDHIEIVGEIGIIGYVLLLNVLYHLNLDPIMLCLLFAVFMSGMFFYPLREIHTAVPFWIMLGAGSTAGDWSTLPLKIAVFISILMIMTFVFTVFHSALEWDLETKEKK